MLIDEALRDEVICLGKMAELELESRHSELHFSGQEGLASTAVMAICKWRQNMHLLLNYQINGEAWVISYFHVLLLKILCIIQFGFLLKCPSWIEMRCF